MTDTTLTESTGPITQISRPRKYKSGYWVTIYRRDPRNNIFHQRTRPGNTYIYKMEQFAQLEEFRDRSFVTK